MKVTHYRQCRMERKINNGVQTLVSWIPEQYAKVNDILKLKNEKGDWIDGWKILSVSDPIPASVAEASSRLHRSHREATDVVLSDLRKTVDDGSYKRNRDV